MLSSQGPAESFTWGSYEGPEGSRRYKLFVPAASPRPARLLVMLHGCTQDPEDFARGTRMNEVAGTKGFMVLYPEQPVTANPIKCWNWFASANQSRGAGEPALLAAMIRKVAADNGIDSTKIHIAGISAGGAMTAILGATYPELFRAMAIHSGIAYGLALNASEAMVAMRAPKGDMRPLGDILIAAQGERRKPIPILILQGKDDPSVNAANADILAQQWTAANAGKARVDVQVIPGLAHAWSGGSKEGTFADEKGPDASREIVDFFLAAEKKRR